MIKLRHSELKEVLRKEDEFGIPRKHISEGMYATSTDFPLMHSHTHPRASIHQQALIPSPFLRNTTLSQAQAQAVASAPLPLT